MQQNDFHTANLNWDFILDKIQDEECLLVLGPEVFANEEGVSYHEQLMNYLNPAKNRYIQRFYEDDDFFLFDDLSKQTLICHDIKTFYSKAVPNETLKRLAEIPFHVIMTVTPDKLLNQAFEAQGFNYQFGFYKKQKDPTNIKAPTKQNPLIYNLFGCLDSEESIILTHNDLYDYFKSIFARKSMPQLLKDELHNIRNILFLGVPFDKWYMQLLLRELEIHNGSYAFLRFAANQSLPGRIETFCTEQFKINFITDKEKAKKDVIAEFIKDLHSRCKVRGIIRQQGGSELSNADKIKNSVAEAELEVALNLLEDCTLDTEIQDDVIMLAGRYRNFKRRSLNNVIREEEKNVQEAQIASDILSLANQLNN